MNEMNVLFNLESPEESGKEILISIENELEENLLYKFLVGNDGLWNTIKDFDAEKTVIWVPQKDGKYIIMVQAKRQNSNKAFEYMSKTDYIIGKVEEKLINNIYLDKEELMVGEKILLNVEATKETIMFRYWIKEKDSWQLIKDYSTDSTLSWTVKNEGNQEFLVECKNIESPNVFDDFEKVEFNVMPLKELQIKEFKCLSTEMLVNSELTFEVNAEHEDNRMILYKFVKINSEGISKCIQDYSTKRLVSYKEKEKGNYKILCMAKDMYSPNEFDDRAVIYYNILPYKPISITSFTTDLSSPQIVNTPIELKVIANGGEYLLYKFIIDGVCSIDSGYIKDSTYIWDVKKAGEYKLEVWVKDKNFDGDYEAISSMNFTVDEESKADVEIKEIIVDKPNPLLVNECVNVKVIAVGGLDLRYSFIVKRNNEEIEKIDYGTHNWVNFTPEQEGENILEVKVKDKYSKRDYDAHSIVNIKAYKYIPANIDYILVPLKEYYVVGDIIKFEVVFRDTKNTLVKYSLNINGHNVEETDYVDHRKYEFKPKCSGVYVVEITAKNKISTQKYDIKKEVKIFVQDALPVTNTKLVSDTTQFLQNEAITLSAKSEGGKEVLYEYYLMEKGEWKLVQNYSRKNYYTFIPFNKGQYRILVLAKSSYKKTSYEDYDIMNITVGSSL